MVLIFPTLPTCARISMRQRCRLPVSACGFAHCRTRGRLNMSAAAAVRPCVARTMWTYKCRLAGYALPLVRPMLTMA